MVRVKYNPKKHNEFTSWYKREVRRNVEEKQRIVEENPVLALRIYNIFKDDDIAEMLVETYKDHPELRHVAYLVARDITHPFEREYLSQQEVEVPFTRSNPEYHPSYALGSKKGYIDSSPSARHSDYLRENRWGNHIRALEDSL